MEAKVQTIPARGHPWRHLTAAPHRMTFCIGVVQTVAVMALWLVELGGRYPSWWPVLPTTAPMTQIHAFLMLYGVFPFFMFGFLMTTYPRWMGWQPLGRPDYVRPFLLMAVGLAGFYFGLFTVRWLTAAGIVLLQAGWVLALGALLRVYRRAPATDKSYETYLNAALAAGLGGSLCFLFWLSGGSFIWFSLAREIGLWAFLVPVLFVVSHRMIPYFSSCVLESYEVVQPRWSLPLLALCAFGHAAADLAGAFGWRLLADAPLALMALHHSAHWELRRSFEVRLLAMLHVAFLAFGLAMSLYALQSALYLATGTLVLGRAPLHALGIGFMAAMVVAMASRVSLGHSGRPLVADHWTWACFWSVELTALVRMAAELPWGDAILPGGLNLTAAALWLGTFGLWTLRYLPMYLRARIDGKPG
jgi:uncharacterized protein involved in response to NO